MKIKILKISKKCYLQKGFDDHGCYGCECDDSCCKFGADFDKESYDLVAENKQIIGEIIGKRIENWFEIKFSNDLEYLGKNSIRSIKGENGYCVFHKQKGKGCILYQLVSSGKITNRRIIPSICRLFPLSWNKSELIVCDEEGGTIPKDCNCLKSNITRKSLFDTQKKEIDDIFDINLE